MIVLRRGTLAHILRKHVDLVTHQCALAPNCTNLAISICTFVHPMHRRWVARQICSPIKFQIVTCLWNRILSWHCNCSFRFGRSAKLIRLGNKLMISCLQKGTDVCTSSVIISSICGSIICKQCKIRCSPMNPLCPALPGSYMCLGKLHSVLYSNIDTLMRLFAAQSLSTARRLFPCQYICEMILVTTYLMMWDWHVSRTGPMPFY